MKAANTFVALGLSAFLLTGGPAFADKDQLVVGIAQAPPSTLHPNIERSGVKAYILGFAIRPITAYDQDWTNSCLLCAELPTIENGLVTIVDRPNGGKGMTVTIRLKPHLK